jgi:hypothetical protein
MSLSTSYFYLLSLVCIGIGSFVLLIVIASVVVFSCRAKDKCHFFSCMTNICIAFQGFSGFLLTIVVIVFLAINFIIASMCDFSYDLSIDPSITDSIRENFSTDFKSFLNSKCFGTDGLKLTEYIDMNDPALVENYNEIGQFLDGFSFYNNFLRVIEPDSFNNNINKIGQNWELYRTGEIDNFDNLKGVF